VTNFFIERQKRKTKYYSEDLGNGIKLDMVLIPEGKFIMGAPESEQDSSDSERPQHEVTVPTFFMGRYPVTQEQWQAVMGKNPSRFKGDKRPVENVSWNNAKRFCDKVSQKTEGKRIYRLPREAEWEYACRGISIDLSRQDLTIETWNERYHQPFCFGETITTELANYNGNYTYVKGIKGEYRQKTTEAGMFPANQFGLCDMHGNVWEWCEDDWHSNYQNAPSDGSAWIDGNSNHKVLRGGSWDFYPYYCRSATRYRLIAEFGSFNFGFRVVCEVPRTL
jgi:formylglycine-generating enzyme required for sulfatase activity